MENQKTATVWVTQESPLLDYTDAERYGEVKFITADEFTPSEHSLRNVEIFRAIEKALAGYNVSTDYVLSSGAPSIVAAVFYVLGSKYPKTDIRFLAWNNRDRQYRLLRIPAYQAACK